MGSYVISISAGTGCYRHIQIDKTATLYTLHQTIIQAFEFVDDHAHAFFMDNKCWNPTCAYYSHKMDGDERLTKRYRLQQLGLIKGSSFKYVFDFGEEWRFQCKVLRELDAKTDIPGIIREVGESPTQYPEPDFFGDEYEDDEEDNKEPLACFPSKIVKPFFEALPISMEIVELVHLYFEAAARLYGVIPVLKLLEFYNRQNPPIEQELFLSIAEIIRHEINPFFVMGPHDFGLTDEDDPAAWDVIDNYLLQDGSNDYFLLKQQQNQKPYQFLPKDEFLNYSDPDFIPVTPQVTALRKYLFDRGDLRWPESILLGIETMAELDFSASDVLECLADEGLTFGKKHGLDEFMFLFQEFNNHTRKQANRGFTPHELFLQSYRGQQLAQHINPPNQLSLFDAFDSKPLQPEEKRPSRNGPYPCGSGKKYKRCCGRND